MLNRVAVAGWLMLALAAQPAIAGQADPVVNDVAAGLQRHAGEAAPSRNRLVSARPEGKMLVVVIAPPPDGEVFTAEQATAQFAAGMCFDAGMADFFADGRQVRVDRLIGGSVQVGAVQVSCPTAAETRVTAANLAEGLQASLNQPLADGLTIVSARAEGPLLVLEMDGPPGWRDHGRSERFERAIAETFCQAPDGDLPFIGSGQALRIDTRTDGADPRQGRVIETCPGE